MKNIFLICLASMFIFTSCDFHRIRGNGLIKTESRDVAAFDGVECDGGYEVQINCQEKQSLSIETDDNILPLIKTEVKNNMLIIDTKGNLSPTGKIRVAISVPDIKEFKVNGSTEGNINKIDNSGIDVDIHGSSKLNINGKSGTLKIVISGSSKIDAGSLVSENSDIRINGSGNVRVQATNSLDVQINGSGNVKYSGEPKSINKQINGSGRIEKE